LAQVEDARIASIEVAQCREMAAHFERAVREQSAATARERTSAMEAREALQKLAKMFERSIEDVKVHEFPSLSWHVNFV
jgi:hypothetical protein